MGTRELPDVAARPMDEGHLAQLVREAMVSLNELIRALPIPKSEVTVLRRSSGHLFETLPRPDLHEALRAHFRERVQLESAQKLLNYLWDHGGHRMKLSRDDGEPDRGGWAGSAFHFVVAFPLFLLWDEWSVRALSDDGRWEAWTVPPHVLTQKANEIAAIECGKPSFVQMTVPLLGIHLVDHSDFELESRVSIHAWTKADKAVYLHKHRSDFSMEEALEPHDSACYLRIVASSRDMVAKKGGGRRTVAGHVEPILRRIKWVLMQVTDPKHLVYELPAAAAWQTGVSYSIRRTAIAHKFPQSLAFGSEQHNSAVALLRKLAIAMKQYPDDLTDVLWLFDRATLSLSFRDHLLEAAIGLDRLLVFGAGESARRFRQYGAALIGDGDPFEAQRNLKEIFQLRSNAAHQGGRDDARFEALSTLARSYLGIAIERVVGLVAASKISRKDGKKLSDAVESYLMSLLYEAAQKDAK